MKTSLAPPAALGLAAALTLACSSPATSAEEPAFREISMDEVERSLGTPGFYVFDANAPELFEKHRVPGARNVKSREVAPALPAEKEAKLVFYCTSPT